MIHTRQKLTQAAPKRSWSSIIAFVMSGTMGGVFLGGAFAGATGCIVGGLVGALVSGLSEFKEEEAELSQRSQA